MHVPEAAQQHYHNGIECLRRKQFADAEACFRDAIVFPARLTAAKVDSADSLTGLADGLP